MGRGQVGGLEVLLDQRVVGDEQAVLEGQVHGGRRLAAPRRRDEDDLRLVHRPQALTVVVLDRVLDGRHPRVVALDVPDPVQLRRDPGSRYPEHLLDPGDVQLEEVDHRALRRVQDLADLVGRRRGEGDRRDRALRGLVEHLDDPAGLLRRRDERDQPSFEPQLRELDEQRVAHRLRADARAVREEEHRRRRRAGRDVGGDRVGGGHASRPYARKPLRVAGRGSRRRRDVGHSRSSGCHLHCQQSALTVDNRSPPQYSFHHAPTHWMPGTVLWSAVSNDALRMRGPVGGTTDASKVAIGSSVGAVIETYDFIGFGTAAALYFGTAFFPSSSPVAGTLAAFATLGVGFAARPIGGIIGGHLGDRVGRKPVLVTSLIVMGLATFAIGLLPTYAAVGRARAGPAGRRAHHPGPRVRRGVGRRDPDGLRARAVAGEGPLHRHRPGRLPGGAAARQPRLPVQRAPRRRLGLAGAVPRQHPAGRRRSRSSAPRCPSRRCSRRSRRPAPFAASPIKDAIRYDWRNILRGIGLRVAETAGYAVSITYMISYLNSSKLTDTLADPPRALYRRRPRNRRDHGLGRDSPTGSAVVPSTSPSAPSASSGAW